MELVFGRKPKDEFCERIARLTEEAKKNTQWRKQYMDWERQRTYDFEAGEQKKAEETATNMLRKKYPPSEISELTGLSKEKVLELQKQLTVENSSESLA